MVGGIIVPPLLIVPSTVPNAKELKSVSAGVASIVER